MIQSLELTHFQSHKSTRLEFSPHVNAIIGESDSGKTAILRALYWLYYNRPSGVEFVSHWNQDTKGQPIEATSVRADFSDNCYVARIRDKNLNAYDNCGQILEAVKTDVPEVLLPIFNVSDVNIQRQMDAPFLLSESSGEVARFFNRIIRLDLIDRVLSRAESSRRQYKKDLEAAEAEETRLAALVETYAWTAAAETLLKKAQNVETRLAENKKACALLTEKSGLLRDCLAEIEKAAWVPKAEKLIAAYKITDASCLENAHKHNLLSGLKVNLEKNKDILKSANWIPQAEKLTAQYVNDEWSLVLQRNKKTTLEIAAQTLAVNMKTLETLPDISKSEKLIRELEARVKTVSDSHKRYAALKATWARICELDTEAERAQNELSALIMSLPKLCPTCGQAWNAEDVCAQ